jgi:uncharacterized protein DUF4400
MFATCFRVWIALWALEILLTLSFVEPSRLDTLVELEFARSRQTLGDAGAEQAGRRTGALLAPLLKGAASESAQEPDSSPMHAAGQAIGRIGERARALLVLMTFRVCSWWELSVAGAACVAAAGVDGLMVRRRRAFRFATTSTVLYNAAGYMLICALMAPLVCLVAPVALPPATPLVGALAAAGAVWLLCAHLPGPSTVIGAQA